MNRFVHLGLVLSFILVLTLAGCGGGGNSLYTASGQIALNSAGLQGVTLAFSNGTASVTTDASGNWSQSGLSGPVTVTPSLVGYKFTPATFTVSAASSHADFTAAQIRVAYIYQSSNSDSTTAAGNFNNFLDPAFPTDQIAVSDIASTDFSSYSLIIIGRGAIIGSNYTTIQNTNLPVIGISVGGLNYFGNIGLGMNGSNVASGQTTQAIVIDAALSVWSFPNALNVSNESTVAIFNSNSQANVLYKPYLDTDGIHIASYNISYDTIDQVGHNLYWSYYNDASDFTDAGGKLFINIVQYMATEGI